MVLNQIVIPNIFLYKISLKRTFHTNLFTQHEKTNSKAVFFTKETVLNVCLKDKSDSKSSFFAFLDICWHSSRNVTTRMGW